MGVLGPFTFLIYINDLITVVQSDIHLFSDDIIMYVVLDNPVNSAGALNCDLSKMMHWANQWLVKLSPPKL